MKGSVELIVLGYGRLGGGVLVFGSFSVFMNVCRF